MSHSYEMECPPVKRPHLVEAPWHLTEELQPLTDQVVMAVMETMADEPFVVVLHAWPQLWTCWEDGESIVGAPLAWRPVEPGEAGWSYQDESDNLAAM